MSVVDVLLYVVFVLTKIGYKHKWKLKNKYNNLNYVLLVWLLY